MVQTKTFSPSHFQIVICDPTARVDVPLWQDKFDVVSTDTCILFIVSSEDEDDPADFALGRADDLKPDGPLVFERLLKTPGSKIAIETVEGDSVLVTDTSSQETRIRIWANKTYLPDKVWVGVD